jgi:D-lactate dehydrogenase
MKAAGDNSWRAVAQDMRYQSLDTCATDGLCALTCPVNINTGHFTKELRDKGHGPISKMVAGWTVHHFKFVQSAVRFINSLLHFTAKYIGNTITSGVIRGLHSLTLGKTPLWDPGMPKTVPKYDKHDLGQGKPYIYFTSCINRVFQPGDKNESLVNVMGQIAISMGIQLLIPENIDHVCCGTPYSSKGYSEASAAMARKTIATLYDSSNQGKIPIVIDTSPCTYQLKTLLPLLDDNHKELYQQLNFMDLVPFLKDLVGSNPKPQLQRHSILHPTCSTEKMGDIESLLALAKICTEETTLPINRGCCAFAGDRGLLVPELTASATQFEADELVDCDPGSFAYSSSRTCEIGMQRATGREYESIALLVRDYLSQDGVN